VGLGYFITGTDTGIGKTVVTAGLLGVFHKHKIDAVALKPIQSGSKKEGHTLISPDAYFYQRTARLSYSLEDLNLYNFQAPVSPSLAAELAGQSVEVPRLIDFCNQACQKHQVTLIEGVGGIAAPLISTYFLVADLALALKLPLLIVTRPNLGTLNHTFLTVKYARSRGLVIKGLIINGFRQNTKDIAEKTNPQYMTEMTGVSILGIVPYLEKVNVEKGQPANLVEEIEKCINWQVLLKD
jgi:dethiobiotin synthetase